MDRDWSLELTRSPKGRQLSGKDYYRTEAEAESAKADMIRRGFEVGAIKHEPGVASSTGFSI